MGRALAPVVGWFVIKSRHQTPARAHSFHRCRLTVILCVWCQTFWPIFNENNRNETFLFFINIGIVKTCTATIAIPTSNRTNCTHTHWPTCICPVLISLLCSTSASSSPNSYIHTVYVIHTRLHNYPRIHAHTFSRWQCRWQKFPLCPIDIYWTWNWFTQTRALHFLFEFSAKNTFLKVSFLFFINKLKLFSWFQCQISQKTFLVALSSSLINRLIL